MSWSEKGDGGAYGQVSGIGTSYDAWGSANQIRDPAGTTWDKNDFNQFSPSSKSSGWGSYHSSGRSDAPPSHFGLLLLVWAVCGLIWLGVYGVQNYIANPCGFFSPNVCLSNHEVFHGWADRGKVQYALSANRENLYLVQIDHTPWYGNLREEYMLTGWRISDGERITPLESQWITGHAYDDLAGAGIELFPPHDTNCPNGCRPFQDTSRAGARHAIARGRHIQVINTVDRTITQEINLPEGSDIYALGFSQDGKQLITFVESDFTFWHELTGNYPEKNIITFEVR